MQNRVLERIAAAAPLPEILNRLAMACESISAGTLCSILLLTSDRRLVHGAAPSLPADYTAAIDGMEIGPARGSCGTAAYTGERVIVEDVQVHPYWAAFRELARAADVRACWSEPIRIAQGDVLGTFAVYYREPRAPEDEDLDVIDSFAHLAGLAIELDRHRYRLEQLIADALADVKILRGLLPICAWCKRVRDDAGSWAQIEAYVARHSEASFSHGICPECTASMRAR